MSILEVISQMEEKVSFQYSYELFGQKINFFANGPFLEGVKKFYEPYYLFDREEFTNPNLSIFVYVEEGSPQKSDPITRMLVYLDESEKVQVVENIIIHDRAQTGIRVMLDRVRNRIYVVGTDLQELNLQLRTFIRDQIFREIEKANGVIVFHGSAVEKNDQAIAFMGVRNSGKTSSLIGLLAFEKYNILSFDRIKLNVVEGKDIKATGLVSRCNIHKIALETNPVLMPIQNRMNISYDDENKVLIPGDILSELTGTTTVPNSRLSLLVLPKIDNELSGMQMNVIEDEQFIRNVLEENLMEGNPEDKHRHWFHYYNTSAEIVQNQINNIIKVISKEVKAIEIRASYDTYMQAIKDHQIPYFQEIQ